jgi:hypothetical protein
MEVGVGVGREDAGAAGETLASHANLDFGMGAEVLQPVRGVVLSDDVEAAFAPGEPDLYFAQAASRASTGGEIEELFGLDLTGLSA